MHEVIIVGGSYAGIAAALQLARGRRRVLVIDAGQRRNRFAASAHGVPGQDGKAPGEIVADAKAQLLRYPQVAWLDGTAAAAEKFGDHFMITTREGAQLSARRLVLATGVRDELPPIPGLAERWGRAVFHCPYCHGYELDEGRLGVLGTGALSMHQALLIPEWGATTFFLNGTFEPDEGQLAQLAARGVTVERERVAEIAGDHAAVRLRDGRVIELAGLFVAPKITLSSPLAAQLGCEMMETPQGALIKTNEIKETSVPGVLACGDAARASGNITFAMADGAMAGVAAHRSLMLGG